MIRDYHKERERQARQRVFVMPECCQDMIDTAAVYLRVPYAWYDGDNSWRPTWCVSPPDMRDGTNLPRLASFCPFCGKAVPEIEPRVTNELICRETDGYYCGTCGKRNQACRCLGPAFLWQPVGSTRPIPPAQKEEYEKDEIDEEE